MPDEQVVTEVAPETPVIDETRDVEESPEVEEIPTTEETAPVVEEGTDPGDRLKAAEREIDRLKRQNEYFIRTREQIAERAEGKAPKVEPKIEDFETIADFNREHAKFSVNQALEEERAKEAIAGRTMANIARVQEIIDREPEFATVAEKVGDMGVAPGTPIYEALFDSDHLEGIVKHLHSNPAEVRRIMAMPARYQAKEIFKLDERVSKPSGNGPVPKRVTNAPAPVKPVGRNEPGAKSYDQMSTEEFIRKRNEEEKQRPR